MISGAYLISLIYDLKLFDDSHFDSKPIRLTAVHTAFLTIAYDLTRAR